MIFFRKRKAQEKEMAIKERQIRSITGHNRRRVKAATKPIERLTKKYEANGITWEIAKAIGSKHG